MKIKNYLPTKIRDKVVNVNVEPDFDYNKNRSVQHYFVSKRKIFQRSDAIRI